MPASQFSISGEPRSRALTELPPSAAGHGGVVRVLLGGVVQAASISPRHVDSSVAQRQPHVVAEEAALVRVDGAGEIRHRAGRDAAGWPAVSVVGGGAQRDVVGAPRLTRAATAVVVGDVLLPVAPDRAPRLPLGGVAGAGGDVLDVTPGRAPVGR